MCDHIPFTCLNTAKSFQEECWWDCTIIANPWVEGQVIANPECLRSCFSDSSSDNPNTAATCFASLIEDVTTKGTCDTGANPAPILAQNGIDLWGWSELDNNCTMEIDHSSDHSGDDHNCLLVREKIIINGTCSDDTETLLLTKACIKSLGEQPKFSRIQLSVSY